MKPLIIAEIGLNHNGDMDIARQLILQAKDAGADIAKFQFFDISKFFPPTFKWYKAGMKARLSFGQAKMLKKFCDKTGIEFMASAFDVQGVKWCEKLGVRRHKLASRCIYDRSIIRAMCRSGKEIIASLGMYKGKTFPRFKTKAKVNFLYCVAKYPTQLKELNFSRVDFKKYSGFSDHTIGIEAALVALSRGARIIEKHFTLDKNMSGADHKGSSTPDELKKIVDFSRACAKIMGGR
jgi:sialic acid synthase SpsE